MRRKLTDERAAITISDIRRELAAEEAAGALRGETQLHEVSASTFLMTGIELEEQQYVPPHTRIQRVLISLASGVH